VTLDASLPEQVTEAHEEAEKAGVLAILGYMTWWKLAGIEVAVPEAIKACEKVGIPKQHAPNIEARGGMTKALEALGLRASPQSGKRKQIDPTTTAAKKGKKAKTQAQLAVEPETRLFYDRLVDNDERIVMSISERLVENHAGQPVARYVERQSVTYVRADKRIECATSFMRDDIEREYRKWIGTYRSDDIATIITNTLRAVQAVRIEDGLYFLPRQSAEWASRLKALCRELGGKLRSLPISDVQDAEAVTEDEGDIRDLTGTALKDELAALITDLDGVRRNLADGVEVRESTFESRLERFEELREKARLYSDLLAIETREIEDKLDILSEGVSKMISGESRGQETEANEKKGED
jgi:hypothetical protein